MKSTSLLILIMSLLFSLPSTASGKIDRPLLSEKNYNTLIRASDSTFVKTYGEDEFHRLDISDENKRVLYDRQMIELVLSSCRFDNRDRMRKATMSMAAEAGWSERQINYIEISYQKIDRISFMFRMMMPCSEEMRIPFKERYELLKLSSADE